MARRLANRIGRMQVLVGVVLVSAMAGMLYWFFIGFGFEVVRVAHAGGGLGKATYTNSYEALDTNYAKGARYFELDFSFTSDRQLVCLHDWEHSFKRTFGFSTEQKVSLDEFKALVEAKSKYTKCTLDGLATWMETHPEAIIVTDVKEGNLEALKIIATTLPDADDRVIPQIYDPKNFKTVKAMGFDSIIWTLYRYRGKTEAVLEEVASFEGPVAITMPKTRAVAGLSQALHEIEVPSYVHTINAEEEVLSLMEDHKVSEVYTDFLIP